MNSASIQFVDSRRIGICEPTNQLRSWAETFKNDGIFNMDMSMIVEADGNLYSQLEDTSNEMLWQCNGYEQEANSYKVQKRLAQNREAAKKSRLRKKAYVQQLESSRLKLIQLEQELQRARHQGLLIGSGIEASHLSTSTTVNKGIAAFETEYGLWLEEQNKQICELRNALNDQTSDVDLGILVECTIGHYVELFRIKEAAAKADVLYMMSGMWKTSTERLFLWIGGFRPSEILRVLRPNVEPLTEEQRTEFDTLRQSCLQAEDCLSQGMDKLQEFLTGALVASQPREGSYIPQMSGAMEKLEELVSFLTQTDFLRQETLQQVPRILSTRQAARGLVALGEYSQRLRALSSLWATRPRDPG